MKNELMLNKLIEVYQLFDEFNQTVFAQNYMNLNINEVHAIDFIGRNKNPNVTKITNHLKITKGAVTKITKKLIENEYIDLYQIQENKKEKYFVLTQKGREVFEKHRDIHEESIKRDKKIFEQFNRNEKEIIIRFLDVLKLDFEEKLK